MPTVAVGDARLRGGVDHEHFREAVQMRGCGMLMQRSEAPAECNLLGRRELWLIAQEYHLVGRQRVTQLAKLPVIQVGEIGAANLGADGRGKRNDD